MLKQSGTAWNRFRFWAARYDYSKVNWLCWNG
uniref:Uncharacterized protein n=1 Tax=Arundo donax TaxID=35708 RepID=A0A0A9FU04_ARUDO